MKQSSSSTPETIAAQEIRESALCPRLLGKMDLALGKRFRFFRVAIARDGEVSGYLDDVRSVVESGSGPT